jgi:hypothetical protein
MTFQPIRGWAAAAVMAGALVSSGCGSDEETAKSATPTHAAPEETPTPATSPLPAAVRGSWQRQMRARDWGQAGKGYQLGAWRLDLERDGADAGVYLPRTKTVDFNPEVVVKGDQLTIDSVPICPGQIGRYSWRAAADILTLTVVDDGGCVAAAALFGGTWHRRP